MKRLFLIFAILFLSVTSAQADWFGPWSRPSGDVLIQEIDGSPSVAVKTIKVSNSSLTDNGDGTATLTTAGTSGQAVILDLADDGTNESTDLGEIAITNDTGSVWSEPSADKLLFNGTNLLYESELDTFAELDTQIADKTLVNTADGATWTGTHDFGGATLEVPNTVVGSLPAATLGRLAIVTDGASDSDCTTGGGSTVVSCMANGATWEPTGDSGTGGGGTPGGSDGQVQYNNGGSFGGEVELFYDDVNNRLGVGTSTPAYTLDVTGAGQFTGALIVGSTLGVTEQVTMTKGVIVNNGRDTTTSGDFLVQGGGITDLIFADASANDVIFDGDVVLTQGTSCTDTTEGSICWDTDDDTLNVGNGASVTTIGGGASYASISETNTGTETAKSVTPDGLAGSNFGERAVQMVVFDYTTDTATGDGKAYFHIDSRLAGMDLVDVHAEVITAGTTGTTDIQIHNVTQVADMLTTKITIDSAETGSDTAATAAVIDTANDDVAENDLLRIDVDAVSTTAAKGLIVTLGFRLP